MKENPFIFGQVVTDQHFTNRDDEIKRLHSNFKSLQNTVLISPRRYGKSSLVKESIRRFSNKERGYIFCFMDLMYVYSEEEFYQKFASTVLQAASSKVEEFIQSAKKFIEGARVSINTGTGEPSLEFGLNFINENIDTILNLPQILAQKKRKKIIVCIDEFQNISRFEEKNELQGRLRSVWQQHDKAAYILYGSRQSMMTNMFNRQNNPFYKFGDTINLGRISTTKLHEYIENSFTSSGKNISEDIIFDLISTVENHPYYAQQLSRNLWLNSGRKVTAANFETAKHALISENLNFYHEILDELTAYQASFLRALLNDEKELYSSHVINTYNLSSSANIRRMYKSFQKKGIIVKENKKTVFADPVFKLIAKRNVGNY